jgi:hypothetical protein
MEAARSSKKFTKIKRDRETGTAVVSLKFHEKLSVSQFGHVENSSLRMKESSIIVDVTLCSPVEFRRFGGMYNPRY